MIDRLWLGWMYAPGFVENIEAAGDAVEFDFVSIDRWRVTVLAAPRRLPLTLFGWAKRPWRRWFAPYRLVVERLPGPSMDK